MNAHASDTLPGALLAAVVRPNPRVAFRDIAGQVVVVVPDARKVHQLNPTGSWLWRVLSEEARKAGPAGAPLPELLRSFGAHFGLEAPAAAADVAAFLATLQQEGALEVTPSDALRQAGYAPAGEPGAAEAEVAEVAS